MTNNDLGLALSDLVGVLALVVVILVVVGIVGAVLYYLAEAE